MNEKYFTNYVEKVECGEEVIVISQAWVGYYMGPRSSVNNNDILRVLVI